MSTDPGYDPRVTTTAENLGGGQDPGYDPRVTTTAEDLGVGNDHDMDTDPRVTTTADDLGVGTDAPFDPRVTTTAEDLGVSHTSPPIDPRVTTTWDDLNSDPDYVVPPPPHNFDTTTGEPLEYDADGYPMYTEYFMAPSPPPGVTSFDPYTGQPLDEHGHVIEGMENSYLPYTFQTNLENRVGVDDNGHLDQAELADLAQQARDAGYGNVRDYLDQTTEWSNPSYNPFHPDRPGLEEIAENHGYDDLDAFLTAWENGEIMTTMEYLDPDPREPLYQLQRDAADAGYDSLTDYLHAAENGLSDYEQSQILLAREARNNGFDSVEDYLTQWETTGFNTGIAGPTPGEGPYGQYLLLQQQAAEQGYGSVRDYLSAQAEQHGESALHPEFTTTLYPETGPDTSTVGAETWTLDERYPETGPDTSTVGAETRTLDDEGDFGAGQPLVDDPSQYTTLEYRGDDAAVIGEDSGYTTNEYTYPEGQEPAYEAPSSSYESTESDSSSSSSESSSSSSSSDMVD